MPPCSWRSLMSGSPKTPSTAPTWTRTALATRSSREYVLGKEDGVPNAGLGGGEDGYPRVDHQGARPPMGEEGDLHHPRQRRTRHSQPLFHRERPPRSPSSGHADAGRAGAPLREDDRVVAVLQTEPHAQRHDLPHCGRGHGYDAQGSAFQHVRGRRAGGRRPEAGAAQATGAEDRRERYNLGPLGEDSPVVRTRRKPRGSSSDAVPAFAEAHHPKGPGPRRHQQPVGHLHGRAL